MGCFWRSRFPVHENGGVLISGASSGLGYSVAVALAEKGYLVFAGVRSDEAASRLKKVSQCHRTSSVYQTGLSSSRKLA